MASVNKVIILGRLGQAPEVKQAQGTTLCNLSVATSRRYKDRDGNRQEDTEWHRVVLFGRTAEIAQQYLQKGSEVYIEGRLRTRTYEKNGQKHYATEIVGETMQLGSKAKDGAQGSGAPEGFESPARNSAPQAQGATDDIPF